MNQRRTLVALATSLAIGVTACSAPVTAPAPATAATSGSATPTSATPAQTTSAQATTAPPATQRSWPTVRGEAGGFLTVGGELVGRFNNGTSAFLKAMGTPDQTSQNATCGKMPLKNTYYRWGDLSVTVLDEEDTTEEYGDTYPPGEVAGWVIDPTLDGAPGLTPPLTGPAGIMVGTDVAKLKDVFTDDEWDYADREGDVFSIFTGDTIGAIFYLDPAGKVKRMSAGYTCSVNP